MNAKKILVPVTLGEGSGAALAVASALAREVEGMVVLLHVLPVETPEEKARADKRLQQLAAKTHPQTPIECLVCAGAPVEKIVEKNREIGADAIVMSSHGDCGWLSWLHQQTARKVLRQVACPVWVVFPGAASKAPTVSLFANWDAWKNFPQAGRSASFFPLPVAFKILMPQG